MRYPLITGDQRNDYPHRPTCPACGKRRVWEPHTFVTLEAGALLMDRDEDSGGPSDQLDGFLHLGWHGAHDAGEGDFRETGGYVPVTDSVTGGAFAIAVCSTDCLRELFGRWVEELEKAMQNASDEKVSES